MGSHHNGIVGFGVRIPVAPLKGNLRFAGGCFILILRPMEWSCRGVTPGIHENGGRGKGIEANDEDLRAGAAADRLAARGRRGGRRVGQVRAETTAGWVKYDKNPVLGGSLGTCFDVVGAAGGRQLPHVVLLAAEEEHRPGREQGRPGLGRAGHRPRPEQAVRLGGRHQPPGRPQGRRHVPHVVHRPGRRASRGSATPPARTARPGSGRATSRSCRRSSRGRRWRSCARTSSTTTRRSSTACGTPAASSTSRTPSATPPARTA